MDMSVEMMIFLGRVSMALLLYVFLAAVGILIWRDLRTAARLAVQEEKGYGY